MRLAILLQAVVDLGCLPAGFGQIVLEEGDLVVVTEVLQLALKGVLVDVMLLRLDVQGGGQGCTLGVHT